MLRASICTVGDEILIGQIVDTNKSYISSALNSIGVRVFSHYSTGDDETMIEDTINSAMQFSDIVIVTGGLGPTKDDITKKVMAKISGSNSYIVNDLQLDIIKEICTKRKMELSPLNRDQALVPNNCIVLPNSQGTAPGMMFKIGDKLLFSLPGVPYEMRHLMESVLKQISNLKIVDKIIHKSINTFGIPESELATRISNWEDSLPTDYKLAYLPNPSRGVKLRLSVYEEADNACMDRINSLFKQLFPLLGDAIYGINEDSLESVILKALTERKETLSVVESCTGGRIASQFTSLPGSSEFFKGGIIAYDNQAKIDILGVESSIIDKLGAVSEECVIAMAEGARRLFDTDWALATSGIAGPGGGSEDKPVGTIWIAVIGPKGVSTISAVYSGDRWRNIIRFSSASIDLLRKTIGAKVIL